MSALVADIHDIVSSLPSDPTLLLISPGHMRTATGRVLLEAVRALGRRYIDARAEAVAAKAAQARAEAQEQGLRDLCDQLTRRVQALEDERE